MSIHLKAFVLTVAVFLFLAAVIGLAAVLAEIGLLPWILGLIVFGVVYLMIHIELECREKRRGTHEP